MCDFKISKRVVHSDSRSTIMEKDACKVKEILDKERKLPTLLKKINKLESNSKEYEDTIKEIEKIKNREELSEYLFNLADFLKEEDNSSMEEINNNSNINKFVQVEKKNNNSERYNDYVNKCLNGGKKIKRDSYSICKNCDSDMLLNDKESILVCYTCGSIFNNYHNEKPDWNAHETTEYVKPFSYKRSNHFKEWLNQIQGREGTNIPEDVLDLLKIEIRKERINAKKQINYEKTKQFLKKLKLNKYYEHIPNIIHCITGNRQLVIDTQLENKLIEMFDCIQEPFKKHCPANRKNFLSYSYTLYKFFQLLKLNEYLVYFPLLKSREKLFEQENIWKNICKDLNWEFIKCI